MLIQKKITIVRHAKPEPAGTGWITSAELGQWINSYNSKPLSLHSNPPAKLNAIVQNTGGIICSNLRRSIETAELLDTSKVLLRSGLFAEAELPYAATSSIKLPVYLWAAIFRVCWFFGYTKNSESRTQTKLRAKDATAELIRQANTHKNVVFVGHGIFNRMVVRELLSDGWRGPKYPSAKYWGYTVYVSTHKYCS